MPSEKVGEDGNRGADINRERGGGRPEAVVGNWGGKLSPGDERECA